MDNLEKGFRFIRRIAIIYLVSPTSFITAWVKSILQKGMMTVQTCSRHCHYWVVAFLKLRNRVLKGKKAK